MSTVTLLDRIGVGIDTARYGHRVSFMRPDRQPAAKPLTVQENQAGYQALQERLEQLHAQHPQAHFHIRIDAAGQYAANLEHFLRSLPLPMTLSIGEPKRNKDYQKAHFPKRTTDDTESQAMARFAVVEMPGATRLERFAAYGHNPHSDKPVPVASWPTGPDWPPLDNKADKKRSERCDRSAELQRAYKEEPQQGPPED